MRKLFLLLFMLTAFFLSNHLSAQTVIHKDNIEYGQYEIQIDVKDLVMPNNQSSCEYWLSISSEGAKTLSKYEGKSIEKNTNVGNFGEIFYCKYDAKDVLGKEVYIFGNKKHKNLIGQCIQGEEHKPTTVTFYYSIFDLHKHRRYGTEQDPIEGLFPYFRTHMITSHTVYQMNYYHFSSPKADTSSIESNKTLPFDAPIVIRTTKGFHSSVYQNWEFCYVQTPIFKREEDLSSGDNNVIIPPKEPEIIGYKEEWIKIPHNKVIFNEDKSEITLKGSDLLYEYQFLELLNNKKPIKIKINVPTTNTPEVLTLNPILSSPYITASEVFPPTCPEDNKGKIKLTFDRDLMPSEILHVYVDGLNSEFSKNINITSFEPDRTLWLEDIIVGSREISLSGLYNGSQTYTSGSRHRAKVTVPNRDILKIGKLQNIGTSCNGLSDGVISVEDITGGKAPYKAELYKSESTDALKITNITTEFSFKNLSAGNYILKIKDNTECVSQVINKTDINISQPDTLKITNIELTNPLEYGKKNGSVTIVLNGGTAPYNLKYRLYGESDFTDSNVNIEKNLINITNLGDGEYEFIVKDANYTPDKDLNCSCVVLDTFSLQEPPPLILTLQQTSPIRCKGGFEGVIEANVTGGIPFTDSYPYRYELFKYDILDNKILHQSNDSIFKSIYSGKYEVKIMDKNGIERFCDIIITEPDTLSVRFVSTPADCAEYKTGSIKAFVGGGTPPYKYSWSVSDSPDSDYIENLSAGNYYLTITDSMGCMYLSSSPIVNPNGLQAKAKLTNPSCYGISDGEIDIEVSGGTAPYEITWGDKSSDVLSRKNLSSGTYKIEIRDSKFCSLSEYYVLEDPELFYIELGNNVTLCSGQTKQIHAFSNYQVVDYKWFKDNAQLSNDNSEIEINQQGLYTILAENENGCTALDSIRVFENPSIINLKLAVPTYASKNDEVHAVNISDTKLDKVEWIAPKNSSIVSQDSKELIFIVNQEGDFEVSMEGFFADCSDIIHKKISILDSSELFLPLSEESLIKQFAVYPNPVNQTFKVLVDLNKEVDAKLLLYSSQGDLMDTKEFKGLRKQEIEYDITNKKSGIYILQLITKDERAQYKILKQ